MARINISIPDDLHEELEKLRADLNVSQVCQDALRAELLRRTPLPEDVDVPEEVLERLAEEKELLERESRERGFKIGTEWARRSHFRELRRWGTYRLPRGKRLAEVITPPYEVIDWLWEEGDLFNSSPDAVIERYPELKHAPVTWDWLRDSQSGQRAGDVFVFDLGDKQEFNSGFLDAVRKFWEIVETRLGQS